MLAPPELGLVLAEFVPLAVRLGRTVPLGRLVLRAALAQIAAEDGAGGPPLVVSVDLSDAELRDADLADATRAALVAAGLPGDRPVREVGEESRRDSPPWPSCARWRHPASAGPGRGPGPAGSPWRLSTGLVGLARASGCGPTSRAWSARPNRRAARPALRPGAGLPLRSPRARAGGQPGRP